MSDSRFSLNPFKWFGHKQQGPITHPSQIEEDLQKALHGSLTTLAQGQAIRQSTVSTCIRVICDTMVCFPIKVRKVEGRNRTEVPDHWVAKLIRRPCRGMSTSMWVWLIQYCYSYKGAAYCRIVWSRGRVVELFPLNPDRVKPRRTDDGERVFDVTNERGQTSTYTSKDIWDVTGMTYDGVVGCTPIQYQMELVNNAFRALGHASNSLKNGGSVPFAVSVANRLKPETRAAMKLDFKEKNSGPSNAGNLLLLEEGAKIEKISMNMAEMQYLESRQFTRAEIAALYGVPPHRVGDNSKSTFTIEQQNQDFITNTMMALVRVWEDAFEMLQEDNRDKVEVKFNMSAVVRADTKGRYAAYASGIASGWLTRNEARELEDRNPLPGLDEPLTPMNSMGDKPGKPSNPDKDPDDDKDSEEEEP